MRALATPVPCERHDLVDTAGTGGGRPTFNVSTSAALIAAGAGCGLAKHGNRVATGLSGSADELEALGARIDLGPHTVARRIDEAGFGFMFAPTHHQATRFVVPVRRELAVCRIAGALARLCVGSVQRGWSRRDEHVGPDPRRRGQRRRHRALRRRAAGPSGSTSRPRRGAGGTPEASAATARAILAGEPGPRTDLAVLNAGAAVYAAAVGSLEEGVDAGREAVASGAALRATEAYVDLSRRLAS